MFFVTKVIYKFWIEIQNALFFDEILEFGLGMLTVESKRQYLRCRGPKLQCSIVSLRHFRCTIHKNVLVNSLNIMSKMYRDRIRREV